MSNAPVDKKVAKLSGQAAACRDLADLLNSAINYGTLRFGFLGNKFATDESKEAFRQEVQRMAHNLNKRQMRLEIRLSSAMGMDMTRTPR